MCTPVVGSQVGVLLRLSVTAGKDTTTETCSYVLCPLVPPSSPEGRPGRVTGSPQGRRLGGSRLESSQSPGPVISSCMSRLCDLLLGVDGVPVLNVEYRSSGTTRPLPRR